MAIEIVSWSISTKVWDQAGIKLETLHLESDTYLQSDMLPTELCGPVDNKGPDQAQGHKTFYMLNSAEHKIYPAHKFKMPTIIGILTFISIINTTSERLKAKYFFICRYFIFYEQLKCSVELSMKKVL